MKNQSKIVICGSPHSGKSVLITSLYGILPQKYTVLIRACPDGEGIYSNNKEQKIIELTRRKGKMSQEFVENAKNAINNAPAQIVLIDVGGLRSKENEEIFKQCDTAIILDKSDEELGKWREFCKNQNLEIIAEIKSILDEKQQSNIINTTPVLTANILNLTRGAQKLDDIVVKQLGKKIYERASEKEMKKTGYQLLSQENVLNMRKLAHELKLMYNDNIQWAPEKAEDIYKYIRNYVQNRNEIKLFEARANWIVGMACETAKKENVQNILLYDGRKNNFIPTQQLKKSRDIVKDHLGNVQKYEVLKDMMSVYLKQDKENTMMQFELNPYKLQEIENLDKMVLPNIDPTKKMYIAGRLPLWLFASITRTYANTEKSVLQPGKGFIKYASENSKELGKIEQMPPSMNLDFFLNIVKKGVTKEQKGDEEK